MGIHETRLFEVDIISDPGFTLYPDDPIWSADLTSLLKYDEDLVKPALLFADTVNLRSAREDMLAMVHSQAMRVHYMPMRRLWNYIGLSRRRDPEELDALHLPETILAPLEEVMPFFQEGYLDEEGSPSSLAAFDRNYATQSQEVTIATIELLRDRRDALVGTNLEKAQEKGYLTSSGWSSEGNDPWSLAWRGQEEFYADGIDDLAAYLSQTSGAVMLDPRLGVMLKRIVSTDGKDSTVVRPTADPTPSSLAASFISRLPGLREVGLDEVIDIREDLGDYLIPFRAAMTELSSSIRDMESVSPEQLEQEVERRWHAEVLPNMKEIERKVRKGGYPRQLLAAFSEDKGALVATTSSVVLAAGSIFAGIAFLAPAAAAAAVPFVKALNDKLKSRDEVRENRMFFLYEVGRRTRNS